ncbi:hypothetical protein PHYPSEUDO_005286 [Phytophthora pseudosyringae]|uniref:Uncharacterized protein n=1 Tax=Phytophthora pseudosyringae TaxID=221518 RepID=A0A8T1WCD7_9STRA|nr:hypothetical protein PHYPSEUDO_005286 [Phytophthora pseudosyringae]
MCTTGRCIGQALPPGRPSGAEPRRLALPARYTEAIIGSRQRGGMGRRGRQHRAALDGATGQRHRTQLAALLDLPAIDRVAVPRRCCQPLLIVARNELLLGLKLRRYQVLGALKQAGMSDVGSARLHCSPGTLHKQSVQRAVLLAARFERARTRALLIFCCTAALLNQASTSGDRTLRGESGTLIAPPSQCRDACTPNQRALRGQSSRT